MADRMGSNPVAHFQYMTIIPGRRGLMKVHKTIGQAKNAILGVYHKTEDAQLYEWDGNPELPYGGWKLLYEVKPNTPHDEMPWVTEKLKTYVAYEKLTSRRQVTVQAYNHTEAMRLYQDGKGEPTPWTEGVHEQDRSMWVKR